MKEFHTKDIRNISLLGHSSTGKTSLAEAMLYAKDMTDRLGRIEEGTTKSDYHEDEKERKHSINYTLLHLIHKNKKINIIDNPGYLDFIAASKSSIRVTDMGLITVNSKNGIETGTDLSYRFAEEENLPLGFIINKLDSEDSNFEETLNQVQNNYGGNSVVPLQLPVNEGPEFNKVIDIINMECYEYADDNSGDYKKVDIPDDMTDRAEELRTELVESIAETDEELLEIFFEEDTLPEDDLKRGLKNAIISRDILPVFATDAYNNIGVTNLLDLIVGTAPAPNEVELPPTEEEVDLTPNDDSPTSCFVYQTLLEGHAGGLFFFRLMSGTLEKGMQLKNTASKETEKIGEIYTTNGDQNQSVEKIHAGDLAATSKLKDTKTNTTLCKEDVNVTFTDIEYPEPVIREAIEPKSRSDEDKIKDGLESMQEEDPTFHYEFNPELKQTIISGQGNLHLKIILNRLKESFKIDTELTAPKIPYRETIRKKAKAEYRHKKQSGGAGQFAEVHLKIGPNKRDGGVEFEETLRGQNVDRVFVPSVEEGIREACEEGILAGYKVTDVKADFYDGQQHPVDSKDIAFHIAGKKAFKEAFMDANPIILEPIYHIEVLIPNEYMGDVMSDISGRRGKVENMGTEGNFKKVTAKVPLAELYHYGTSLRSMTHGAGLYHREFSHYSKAPSEKQKEIVEKANQDEDDN